MIFILWRRRQVLRGEVPCPRLQLMRDSWDLTPKPGLPHSANGLQRPSLWKALCCHLAQALAEGDLKGTAYKSVVWIFGVGKMRGCLFLREESWLTKHGLGFGFCCCSPAKMHQEQTYSFTNVGSLTHCREGEAHHRQLWGVSVRQ